MLAWMWRNRNTSPLLVGMQVGTTTLEVILVVPQKTGNETTGGPCYTIAGHIPRGFPACNKDTCSIMFIAALFIIVRAGKNPDVPQWRNGYRKHGIVTQWNTTQQLKTTNSWNF